MGLFDIFKPKHKSEEKRKKKLEEKEAKKSLKDKQKKEPPAKIDEDKEYAKILLSRNAGSWHRGDDEIFSKILMKFSFVRYIVMLQ